MNMDMLFFLLAVVSFTLGGGMGTILKDVHIRYTEYKLTEDLKDAKAEILRLRAQVANLVGRQ